MLTRDPFAVANIVIAYSRRSAILSRITEKMWTELELIIWVDNAWTARNQLNLSTKSHGKSFKMPHFVAKYVCSHGLTHVCQIRYDKTSLGTAQVVLNTHQVFHYNKAILTADHW